MALLKVSENESQKFPMPLPSSAEHWFFLHPKHSTFSIHLLIFDSAHTIFTNEGVALCQFGPLAPFCGPDGGVKKYRKGADSQSIKTATQFYVNLFSTIGISRFTHCFIFGLIVFSFISLSYDFFKKLQANKKIGT